MKSTKIVVYLNKTHMNLYSTRRTIVRRLTLDDRNIFAEIISNVHINRFLSNSFDGNTEKIHELISHVIHHYDGDNPINLFALVRKGSDDKMIGLISYKKMNEDDVEIFGALVPELWGSKISDEMISGLTEFIWFKTNFKRIIAFVKMGNKSVCRLLVNYGFEDNGISSHTALAGNAHTFILRRKLNY